MPRGTQSLHAKLSDFLFEKDFGHHAFVLMAERMTVKQRYAPDDRIGEVHHQANVSLHATTCAVNFMLPRMAKHMRLVNKFLRAFEVRYDVMARSLRPIRRMAL
jgi:hypothetical protein